MGVDSFKTDFGERIPTDVVYADGSDPMKMHNYYTFLYNRAVFEVLEEKLGKHEAMLFARSATAGGQQFPVHWGGDNSANYESMAETLRGGLSLGMSGFGFWSHDISGFERTRHRTSTNAGSPSACCPPIAVCTATNRTACLGCSAKKRSMCCAISRS